VKNRTALITGATRGLGLAISKHLAGCGTRVAMNYGHNKQDAATALEAVSAIGEAALFKADVMKKRGAQKLIDKVSNEMGPIDILVVNATPAQPYRRIDKYEDKDFESMMNAFLMSPHYLTSAVMASMKERDYGRIIHITSEVFYRDGSHFSAYASAKGAQVGYLRSSAMELAPFGITVNGVAPGWIPVERHSDVPEAAFEDYRKTIPVGRMGQPEDIATAVAYFASEAASFVTGQSLIVNGGRHLL
jgi:3-oxoacyl-[acyl-carrier protein] reductase